MSGPEFLHPTSRVVAAFFWCQQHPRQTHYDAGRCAASLPCDGPPRKCILLDAGSKRRGAVPGPGACAHSACPTCSSSRPAMCQHGCVAERAEHDCGTNTAAIGPVRIGERDFRCDSRQVGARTHPPCDADRLKSKLSATGVLPVQLGLRAGARPEVTTRQRHAGEADR